MNDESKFIELNKAKWDKWSETFDKKGLRNEYLRKAQLNLISKLKFKDNTNFLDIGCGTGWAVGVAARTAGYKGSFYGVDLSPGMITRARENFRENQNIYFIEASSDSIPLQDSFFDIIICTNSFHHYLHPDRSLTEMHRLLKDGGMVYILDPTADTWIVKLADKIIRFLEPTHVKIYSTEEFINMMTVAGLKYSGTIKTGSHEIVHTGIK